ncbi:Beta-glucosidase, lactase phlorizinhydrolase [Handroanthus impetiginosus]|uniref:Beta-glucosidase, lactase phlorizinhydrolase n=1 Tax=Handroanthus impetiginosus TaxID=429701 RepID=A0A2G9G1A9_9LAMI|nr:Beta-glucosidase, lactase phlorizinhydrolase [Handroanthus impetiginosus]
MAGRDTVPAPEVETQYSKLTRHDFPEDFIFGSGTSAYQHEGGAAKGGRGISVWDSFTMRTPHNIADGSNGNEAVDMYTRYKEDIKMMKNMGFKAYRFSISWPRVLPGGKICLGVNQEGIDFYNDLIDTLIAHEIKPFATLFHWDLPYPLEQEYQGFLSDKIVDDFRDFAELCFWKFGDRVKYWTTLNEPWTYTVFGYVERFFPPGKRQSLHTSSGFDSASARDPVLDTTRALLSSLPWASAQEILGEVSERASRETKRNFIVHKGAFSNFITQISDRIGGSDQSTSKSAQSGSSGQSKLDPAKEAYIVAKNLLLAHAAAVESYKKKFQKHQKGKIGITLVTHWFEPFDNKDENKRAAERALDFMLGWFLEPVLCGEYPESMMQYASQNIAKFSENESELLKSNKIDFLGLNYYTANYAKHDPNPHAEEGYYKDLKLEFLDEKDGKKIGEPSGSPMLFIVPWGINKLLKYVDNKYGDKKCAKKYNLPDIYITENGICDKNDYKLTPCEACADKMRVNYYRDHLGNILDAMKGMKETKVKGYFVWSWCDNFEWKDGYTFRFGIIYIDYQNHLTRYLKDSATWFSKFLAAKDEGKEKEEKKQGGDGDGDDDDEC